jgi:hypothetical protein
VLAAGSSLLELREGNRNVRIRVDGFIDNLDQIPPKLDFLWLYPEYQ